MKVGLYMNTINEIVTTNTFSSFFPKELKYEITRSNILDSIFKHSENNAYITLNGDSGSGKTVVLKQLCQKKKCISIFIENKDYASSDLSIIFTDLIKQINFLTKNQINNELPKEHTKLEVLYRKSLTELRHYSISNGPIYFIIDGLYHIDEDSESIIDRIIDKSPISYPGIKVIFTLDDSKSYVHNKLNKLNHKSTSIDMIGLSTDEMKAVFKEVNIEEAVIEEIREVFFGNPLEIIELRNLAETEEIEEIPKNIFEYIWDKQDKSELDLKLLSLIVFSYKSLEVSELLSGLNITNQEVENVIARSYFLIEEDLTFKIKNLAFLNDLELKLQHLKKEACNLLIKIIFENEKKQDYWLLTKYYEETEQFQELINILDNPDYTNSVIETNSIGSLRVLVRSGLKGADKVDSLSNIYKYALESSLMIAQTNSNNSDEIEALMLLNKEEKAKDIALNSRVIEEKLFLLAIIGRIQKEKRGAVDESLLTEIQNIYEEIDPKLLEEKGMAIASELISIDISLAINLLEKLFDYETDSNAIDKIMLTLSLDSLMKPNIEEKYAENIKNRMKDNELKTIFSTLFKFSKYVSSTRLIEEISKIENIGAKISFLVNWCETNEGGENTYEILNYSFNLLNSSDDYKTNTGIYYKLSKQLTSYSLTNYKENIELFENIDEMIRKQGPTVEYVKIKLNIIACLDKNDKYLAANKLSDLYDYIDSLNDLSVKLECRSLIIASLNNLENKLFYENSLSILDFMKEHLENELMDVTNNFAFQVELLGKTVHNLAYTEYEFCCEVVNKVNTITNKEKLYFYIVKGILFEGIIENDTSTINSEIIKNILKTMNQVSYDYSIYDKSLYIMVEELENSKINKNKTVIIDKGLYNNLLNSLGKVRNSRYRSLILSKIYNLFSEEMYFDEQKLSNLLYESWNNIDILPNKIAIGYEIVNSIAKTNLQLSSEFFDKVYTEKKEKSTFNSEEFWIFSSSIRLLIHSFKGISENDVTYIKESLKNIDQLIEQVESNGEKAILYSQLILAIENKIGSKIIKEINSKIIDKINEINDKDIMFKAFVIRKCAPALYINSNSVFENLLRFATPLEKDDIYFDICTFLFTGTSSYEPFDFNTSPNFKCKYEDLVEIINITKKIENDSYKYTIIDQILDIIKYEKVNLNKDAKTNLKVMIIETIETTFNNIKFIQHEGYKILCKFMLEMCFDNYNISKIEKSVDKISEIPNISDRIFCLTKIASNVKDRHRDFRLRLLDEIENLIEKLSSTSEKILRLEGIVETFSNDQLKRKYIKQAMDLIENFNEPKVEKRLIDLAYQVNPEFANSLVSSIDNNSVDLKNKEKNLKKQIESFKIREKIVNDKGKEKLDEIGYKEIDTFAQACWQSYAGLMSGNIKPRRPDLLKEYLRIASKITIEKAFPIFSYFVENINRKSSEYEIKAIFDASKIAANFSLANKHHKEKTYNEIEDFHNEHSDVLLVNKGEREESIKFIAVKLMGSDQSQIKKIIIVDPYFEKEDLKFIYSLYQEFDNDDVEFKILTCKSEKGSTKDKESFKDYWKNFVSSQQPPDITVNVVVDESTMGKPFHDRYIIGEYNGLSITGSINGLGKDKELNISLLSETLRKDRELLFLSYLNNNVKYRRL